MESMLSTRRAQLNLFLQTMIVEGVVNNQFLLLQHLKASNGRDVVIRTIIAYWSSTKHLFTQMSRQLDMYFVDFYDIMACAQNLLEGSNSMGAVLVSVACTDIIKSCQEQDIDRCKQGIIFAKREFARLQVKFESVVELERDIIECEDMETRGGQH